MRYPIGSSLPPDARQPEILGIGPRVCPRSRVTRHQEKEATPQPVVQHQRTVLNLLQKNIFYRWPNRLRRDKIRENHHANRLKRKDQIWAKYTTSNPGSCHY